MAEILHHSLPEDLSAENSLPGIRPLAPNGWLRCDEAYAKQVAYRRALIADSRNKVLWDGVPEVQNACDEVFSEACKILPGLGFEVDERSILCPDGARVSIDSDTPLAVLGRVLQEDLCILLRDGDEHVLVAANVCFPANWALSEKVGRPLSGIHAPVDSYTPAIAGRVQRLFDGVKVGKPLWRNNLLWYDEPELFQPRRHQDPDRPRPAGDRARYLRAERQSILRLTVSKAVVFSIHTYVMRQDSGA